MIDDKPTVVIVGSGAICGQSLHRALSESADVVAAPEQVTIIQPYPDSDIYERIGAPKIEPNPHRPSHKKKGRNRRKW